VLDYVTRDDEVLTRIGKPAETISIEIRHDVRFAESWGFTEFWEERAVDAWVPTVDVLNIHSRRDWERDVPWSDFDPCARKMGRESSPDGQRIWPGHFFAHNDTISLGRGGGPGQNGRAWSM
jgi:hypothetical protein